MQDFEMVQPERRRKQLFAFGDLLLNERYRLHVDIPHIGGHPHEDYPLEKVSNTKVGKPIPEPPSLSILGLEYSLSTLGRIIACKRKNMLMRILVLAIGVPCIRVAMVVPSSEIALGRGFVTRRGPSSSSACG